MEPWPEPGRGTAQGRSRPPPSAARARTAWPCGRRACGPRYGICPDASLFSSAFLTLTLYKLVLYQNQSLCMAVLILCVDFSGDKRSTFISNNFESRKKQIYSLYWEYHNIIMSINYVHFRIQIFYFYAISILYSGHIWKYTLTHCISLSI